MKLQWLAKHWVRATAITLATATAIDWFASLTYGMFDYRRSHGWAMNWWDLWVCAVLISVTFAAGFYVQRFAKRSPLVQKLEASRHPGLILFLSQALGPKEEVLDEGGEETVAWLKFKARFMPMVDDFAKALDAPQTPSEASRVFGNEKWRMPMVAIAHQAAGEGVGTVLRSILAITSADSRGKNGTWREAAFFQEMILRLFEQRGRPQDCPRVDFPFAGGINFFDLRRLSEAVEACYKKLADEGIRDVVVDVTGGNKECSIAGAAHALEPGFALQYVSTEDWSVGQFDLTYRSAQSDAG
jgi:hypothetical protein